MDLYGWRKDINEANTIDLPASFIASANDRLE
jgi:hypothetical protein